MSLEIQGKIIKIMPMQSGNSARGQWQKQEFVIETKDKFPKKACFSVWGDKIDSLKNYTEGAEVTVSFNVESREYNQRWYTDLRAWKIEGTGSATPPADAPPPFTEDDIPPPEEEDLPF